MPSPAATSPSAAATAKVSSPGGPDGAEQEHQQQEPTSTTSSTKFKLRLPSHLLDPHSEQSPLHDLVLVVEDTATSGMFMREMRDPYLLPALEALSGVPKGALRGPQLPEEDMFAPVESAPTYTIVKFQVCIILVLPTCIITPLYAVIIRFS